MSEAETKQNEFIFANRYKIDSSLGTGGMAEVFHAFDTVKKKHVAIKVLHTDLLLHQDHIRRFKQQAGTLLKLGEHKNIVKIFEIDEVDNIPYIVMEFLDGTNLSELLKKKNFLPFNFILSVLIQVCSAIEHVHKSNMIHGDIKPSNIFITVDQDTGKPVAKVLDFEFAQIIGNNIERFGGTYHYMSPEQTGMIHRNVDHRSDLYSIGIVFFQLLTKKVPFNDEDSHKILYSHCAKKPPVPSALSNQVPAIFDKIILKLLSKEAADRYQSARGLQIDLINVLQSFNYGKFSTDFEIGLYDLRGQINYSVDFVNRADEIQTLKDNFMHSIEGHGRIVLLGMEDGLGRKSFPYSITNFVLKQNGYFLSTSFKPISEQKEIFEPFFNIISSYLKRLNTYSSDIRKNKLYKIKNSLGKDIKFLAAYVPEIMDFFGVTKSEIERDAYKKEMEKIISIISVFISNISDKKDPAILVFEEVHNCDNNTLRALNLLIDKNPHTHNFLMCTYDYTKVEQYSVLNRILIAISKQKYVQEIILNPLNLEQTTSLIQEMLGESTQETQIFAEKIYQRVSGYPEIIKSILENLQNQEIIFYEDNKGWQVNFTKLDTIPISKSGLDSVIRELSKLNPEENKLVSFISALKYDFHFDFLYKIYLMINNGVKSNQEIKNELEKSFQSLINKQIIVRNDQQDGYYKIIHENIREMIYKQIQDIYRPVVHEQISWVLNNEKKKNSNYISNIEFRLAHHYSKTFQLEKAMYSTFDAGEKAKNLYNMPMAKEFFLKCLEFKHEWQSKYSAKLHEDIEHIKKSIHAIDERHMLDLFDLTYFQEKLSLKEKEIIRKRIRELILNQNNQLSDEPEIISNDFHKGDLLSERVYYKYLITKFEEEIKQAEISVKMEMLERQNRHLKQFESSIHQNLVSIYRFEGDYLKAIEHLNKVLTLEDNKLKTIQALEDIAICYFESGKRNKSIYAFQDAVKLLNKNIPATNTGIKLSYLKQKIVQFFHRLFPKSFIGKIPYINISETHVATIELCINLAFYYYDKDRTEIITYILIGLNFAEKINNKEKLALLYSLYGYQFALKPIPDKKTAFHYLEKGLALAKDISAKKSFKNTLATCFRLMGMVCYFFHKIPDAIRYLEESVELYEELGNKWEIMHALRGLGLTYLFANYFEKLPKIFAKMQEIADLKENNRELSWLNILKSKYYYYRANPEKGMLNKAKEHALTAFENIKQKKANIHIAIIEKTLGIIYLKEERYSTAIRYLKRSYERVIAEKLYMLELEDIYTHLSEAIILSVSAGHSNYKELNLVKKLLSKAEHVAEIYPMLKAGVARVKGMYQWITDKQNKAIKTWLDARKELVGTEKGKDNVYEKALLLFRSGLLLHEIANPRGIELLQEAYLIFKDIRADHEYELLREKLGFGSTLKDRGRADFKSKEESTDASSTFTSSTFTATSNFSSLMMPKSYSTKVSRMIGLKELDFVMSIGKEISGILDINELTDKILEKALIVVTAERGFLLLYDDDKNLYIESSTTGEDGQSTLKTISKTAIKIVENSMDGTFVEDAQLDPKYKLEPAVTKNNLRSIIAVPLIAVEKRAKKIVKKLLGILYLDNRMISGLFEENDLEMLKYFTGLAAMGIKTAQLVEERDKVVQSQAVLDVARNIQEGILPKKQNVKGYDICMKMHTATEVGGDYYDLLSYQEKGKHWFSIGDVSGHGINSGLIMLMTQSMVSAVISENPDASPNKILHTINAPIYGNIVTRLSSYLYVVLTLGSFDEQGNFEVIGTQIPPIIYRAKTKKCEIIDLNGYLIGVLPDIPQATTTTKFHLAPGDIVMFATDGAWEIRNHDLDLKDFETEKELRKASKFGVDRLMQILKKNAFLSATEIMEEIFKNVTNWGPIDDDITIILFKRNPEEKKVIKVELT